MAVAGNSIGTTDGLWVNFSTLNTISPPTDIICNANGSAIELSWLKADASQTYIRYNLGSYPTLATGYLLPNQSGVDYTHTGLSSGTTYYYTLWGLEAGNTSTTNTTILCSTTAGTSSATTVPLPTSNTSGWSNTPNGSALVANPLYGLGNQEAAAIGIPQGTWWMLLGMGGLVVCGLFIYSRTSNLLLSMIAMIVIGVILAQMSIFPIWTMFIFGFAGIGLAWKELR
jgi:hypothetical protein